MEFFLKRAILAETPRLNITHPEFEKIKKARLVLTAAFSFEENYDLLVGNFIEMEGTALALTTKSMMQPPREYAEMFDLSTELNRRAINFLTTAKMFVDQLTQRVGACGGDKASVTKQTNIHYEASFEYRFMEALRNHVQHSGSAVHGLTFGGRWGPGRHKQRMIFAAEVYTEKRYLELDPKFKKTILAECPPRIDLLKAARKYLALLSQVHGFARDEIEPFVTEARRTMGDAIKTYSDYDSNTLGLTAYASDGSAEEKVAVFLDWDDVRVKLASRNRKLTTLDRWVVSSVASKDFGEDDNVDSELDE